MKDDRFRPDAAARRVIPMRDRASPAYVEIPLAQIIRDIAESARNPARVEIFYDNGTRH